MNIFQKTAATLTIILPLLGGCEQNKEINMSTLKHEIGQYQKTIIQPNIALHKADSIFQKVQFDEGRGVYSSIELDINLALEYIKNNNNQSANLLQKKLELFSYKRLFVYRADELIAVPRIDPKKEGLIVEYQPSTGRQSILRDDRNKNLHTLLTQAQAETTVVYVEKPVEKIVEKPIYIDRVLEKPVEKIVEKKIIQYVQKPKPKDPELASIEDEAKNFFEGLQQLVDDFYQDKSISNVERSILQNYYDQHMIELKHYAKLSPTLNEFYAKSNLLKARYFQ